MKGHNVCNYKKLSNPRTICRKRAANLRIINNCERLAHGKGMNSKQMATNTERPSICKVLTQFLTIPSLSTPPGDIIGEDATSAVSDLSHIIFWSATRFPRRRWAHVPTDKPCGEVWAFSKLLKVSVPPLCESCQSWPCNFHNDSCCQFKRVNYSVQLGTLTEL